MKGENGKLSTPSASLVHPVSGGQSVWCGHKSVVVDSSPCRGIEGVRSPSETGGVPRRGEGVDRDSLRSLRSLRETQKLSYLLSHAKGAEDAEGGGDGKGIIHPLRRFALPSVAMGIATLRGHRKTFSHSSKDPLRPPVSEGQSEWKTER